MDTHTESVEALCERVGFRAEPALVRLCRQRAGLDVSRPRIVGPVGPGTMMVSFTVCRGDVCERRREAFPLEIATKGDVLGAVPLRVCEMLHSALATPLTAAEVFALLVQPAALAAVLGLAFLWFCVSYPLPFTDALLALVGGRALGLWVWRAAFAAHLFEAAYAAHLCAQLRFGPMLAACHVALVALVGFPCLRWLLKMRVGSSTSI